MKNSKNIRLIELLIVTAVAFGATLFKSVCILLTGAEFTYSEFIKYPMIFMGSLTVNKLAITALVIYFIIKPGRSLKELGFSWYWTDFFLSIVLLIVVELATRLCSYLLYEVYYVTTNNYLYAAPKNIGFIKGGINVWSVADKLVNPFFEEFFFRAYIISEVKFLTNNLGLAFFISVTLQGMCHLYQGFGSALIVSVSFIIFSLYYI
ncbi:MAG: CPBP family intramembrane metalloprotease, partial [Rhizonema sp. PD37]|nr:CPBP family intramembrane metalloprotease [Rhizonema sp. PD37]